VDLGEKASEQPLYGTACRGGRLLLRCLGLLRERGRGAWSDLLDGRLLAARRAGLEELGQGLFLLRGKLVAWAFVPALGQVLGAHPLDLEGWGLDVGVRDQDDRGVLPFLDIEDRLAFLIEQEGGHIHREPGDDALAVLLHGLLFDDAQDGEGEGLNAADGSLTAATGTDPLAGLFQGGF
jgi:hypothetical protein